MPLKEGERIILPTHCPEPCLIRSTIAPNRILKIGCVAEIYPFVKKVLGFCRDEDLRVERLAVLLIWASFAGLSQVPDMRQSTKAPSDGFRPSEFPPRGPDFEVIAGGIGCMVSVRESPGTAGRRDAAVLKSP